MSEVVEADAPIDNLIRARCDAGTIEMRASDGGDGRTLFGHFSVFDTWTEIDSFYEGRFLERVAPGAFKQAFKNKRNIRVLFEHGSDPQIGSKPIADPKVMREDAIGAYYEAELFDAGYANDLLPALRAGQLGASFRFSVVDEEWVNPSKKTVANPDRLKERTIRSVNLYEFGPVTWGAYPEATAGVRSGTDQFIDRLLHDPKFAARYTERVGLKVAEQVIASLTADGRSETPPPITGATADGLSTGRTRNQRRAIAALLPL